MITCMNRVEYLNQILPLKTFLISQKDSKKRCENTKKKKGNLREKIQSELKKFWLNLNLKNRR